MPSCEAMRPIRSHRESKTVQALWIRIHDAMVSYPEGVVVVVVGGCWVVVGSAVLVV